MELRITGVFSPLSRAVGFFLSEMGVSPTAVESLSFVTAILSFLLFVFSFSIPLISIQTILTTAVVLIFANALLDDVSRQVETRKRKKSLFGGPLGIVLGQLSDFFIIFGALIFLSLKDTYYNFGRFMFFNLAYVEPGVVGHFALGLLSFIGIVFLRHLSTRSKEKNNGLWNRSERMYVLFGFSILGVFSGMFSGFLFAGILFLTLLIYLSVVRRVLNLKSPKYSSSKYGTKIKRSSGRIFIRILSIIKMVVRGILRAVGVILLGIYLTIEKLYNGIRGMLRLIGGIKLLKKSSSRTSEYSYKHPPIKPFEGSISPAPSALPAESERSDPLISTDTGEPQVKDADESKEEPAIELPPPTHLIESDSAYTYKEEVGESMLVEYAPTAKKEEVLIDIVDFMMSEGRDIVIASTQPATTHYRNRFKEVQGIRIIDLPDQSSIPSKDEIPMTNLEYFSEVFEELNKQHVFVFDSLSNLILNIGVAQAYRFVSQTMTRMSKVGVTFIVFINNVGHDKKDISNFENLFMNIATIESGKLKKMG